MGIWQELNDFSMYEKHIPCVLCKEKSFPTVTATHFKCEKCDHLFNEDVSPLPEGVVCYCKACNPELEQSTPVKNLEKKKKKGK